jgi:RNA polymerase sigma-70 factor (ECF subfamily)
VGIDLTKAMGQGSEQGSRHAEGDLLSTFLLYRANVRRVLRGYLPSQDIDDVMQEAFLRFLRAARKQTIQFPKAFLAKIATNLALNHLKNANDARTCTMEDYSSVGVSLTTDDLETQVHGEERFAIFCRAVAELPPQCRKVFILKKVYGTSQREIAEKLKISESTVEKHVAKGLLLCRNYMAQTRALGP